MRPAKKTGAKTGHFKKGHDPRRGAGKKGRSGRKPLAFVQECERLSDAEVIERVAEYLAREDRGPEDPAWQWCARMVVEYSKSKAPVRSELTGANGTPLLPQTWQFGEREITF